MANVKITGLASLTSGTVDRANDVLEIADVSASQSKKITPNALMGISGNAVGDTDVQTLTNKTLTAPTISAPVFSGTITGTYTIGGTPTFPSSVVTLTGSQTLTNKTLTSPTINTATIVNPTITADSIAGFTTSNTGTIYGIGVTAGVITSANSVSGATLTANSVQTASLANASVTSSKLGTGAASTTLATSQTTASATYTDLGTVGPTVTVTIGLNGLALVIISCTSVPGTSGTACLMSYAVSGATTVAANDVTSLGIIAASTANQLNGGFSFLATGLTPGSNTFTAKYRQAGGGTGTFANRVISVVPL